MRFHPVNPTLAPAPRRTLRSLKWEGATNNQNLSQWIRLPKTGEREFYTGLSWVALNALILRTKQNPKPPVRSISLKDPHQVRGIRLIKLASLLAHLEGLDDDFKGGFACFIVYGLLLTLISGLYSLGCR